MKLVTMQRSVTKSSSPDSWTGFFDSNFSVIVRFYISKKCRNASAPFLPV